MLAENYRVFFEKLLGTDCTTGSEFLISELLADYHLGINLSVTKQIVKKKRNNIFAFSVKKNCKRLLFTSHIDTVPPHLSVRHDDKADCYYGRGACDTKGGIIAQLIAGETLEKTDIAVDYLWVIGEETDHIGAKEATNYYKQELANNYQYEMIILCEPTGMKLANAQKGILKATITFSGKMAHSGFPELGIDANRKMIETSSVLYNKADTLSDSGFGSLDINIGMIRGGQAANVISSQAEFTFLARTNSHHQKFKQFIEKLKTKGLTIDWISDHQPINFEYIKNNTDNYVAKFNTDVVFLSQIAPVYLIGPGNIIHAHADNEHIFVKDIENGVASYIKLVKQVMLT